MLGSRFQDLACENYQIISIHHHNPLKDTISLDITKEKEVLDKLTYLNPDVVIHSAALTQVDYCEENHALAWKVNVKGTCNLVNICEKLGARLIYVSTDFVFDGSKGMYSEDDKPNPLNYYAYTKLKGEEIVKKSELEFAIARVSVLYGWHNRTGFVNWVINELQKNHTIKVVDDHYNSPTLANNAALAILRIIEKNKTGIYHTAGSERISRFQLALNIARVFELDETLIKPVSSSELKQKAKRPRDSSLSVNKVRRDLKIRMLDTKKGLKIMKEERL